MNKRTLKYSMILAAGVLLLIQRLVSPALSASRLADASSPYLKSHAADPVDWRQWNEAAFTEARRTGKPVFVSVGYLACHWCHVMQRESFSDPDVAALINDNFIPVLVDREERPDIDAQLIRAAVLMGLPTGWPLNVFITPEGTPFYAGTYFPPQELRGMPAFSTVLGRVKVLYLQSRNDLLKYGEAFTAAFKQSMRGDTNQNVSPEHWLLISSILLQSVDPFYGGFGKTAKFPQFPAIMTLWRRYLRTGDSETGDAVRQTMNAMIDGGIYDHLGGGFARYTTDPAWQIPHFEKMLDVNAMALLTMTEMWRESGDANLEYAIRGTAGFLINEMQLAEGGFASSLDADSEGEEGTFYVWTAEEINMLLGTEAQLAKEIYGITDEGNWEGKSILNRSDKTFPEIAEKLNINLAALQMRRTIIDRKLRAYRARRERPQRDSKVLADWNGLVISALAEAGAAFDEPLWINAARQAYDFVTSQLKQDGQLRHSWSNGKPGKIVTLGDYGTLSLAAFNLFEITGDGKYREQATAFVRQADTLWNPNDTLYRDSPSITGMALPAYQTVEDSAYPAGNALMAEVLTRLEYSGVLNSVENRPEQIFAPFLDQASASPRHFGGILNAMDSVLSAEQIVIIGDRSQKPTQELIRAVFSTSFPARVFQVIAPGKVLPDSHPAKNKRQIKGKATAYICVGTLCSFPVTDPREFKETAREMRKVTYESAVKQSRTN